MSGGPGGDGMLRRGLSPASISRLPEYLRGLLQLSEQGIDVVSSDMLAEVTGVSSAMVRKDLSYLGTHGTRGVGYDVQDLSHLMQGVLGLDQEWPIVIVGAGNLGRALAGYGGLGEKGFSVVALVDSSPTVVGSDVAGFVVYGMEELKEVVAEKGVAIGVIATPASSAQDAADRLVEAGVTSIMNFAPCTPQVPRSVDVRRVDLSIELQILAFHGRRKASGGQ